LCPDCAAKHGARTRSSKNQRGESDA
jgi:hypothetical protein